ncbi:MAG: tail fiber protein [Nitrospinota bacterium]|nr:tail fiber protein [Nitrospinota bacterium]
MSEPYMAQVQLWGCNFAPRGWAYCNGQLLNIAEYTALFAVIGTTYGGDGRIKFGLPNLTVPGGGVRAAIGQGKSPGSTSTYRLGDAGGVDSVTLQTGHMPSHTHTLRGNSAYGGIQTPSGENLGAAVSVYTNEVSAQVPISPSAVGFGGDGAPHENRQPFQAIGFCIALEGLFPPRN